jgi:hypothetical protein
MPGGLDTQLKSTPKAVTRSVMIHASIPRGVLYVGCKDASIMQGSESCILTLIVVLLASGSASTPTKNHAAIERVSMNAFPPPTNQGFSVPEYGARFSKFMIGIVPTQYIMTIIVIKTAT